VDTAQAGFAPGRIAQIEREIAEFVARGKMAGAVMLISRDGKLGSYRAFGWQDREAQIPMSKNSIFRVLSMSKSVTCAALMCLVMTANSPYKIWWHSTFPNSTVYS